MGQHFPLSLEQESLFGVDAVTSPNIAITHRLHGELDAKALGLAVDAVAERHESLRFRLVTGEPAAQWIGPVDEQVFAVEHVPDADEAWRCADAWHAVPFELTRECPLRVRLLRIADDDHFLVTTVHPAAVDAWGVGVFQQDLWAFYHAIKNGAPDPEPLALRFSDHVQAQHAAGPDAEAGAWDRHLERLRSLGALPLPWTAVDGPPRLMPRRHFVLEDEVVAGLARAARRMCVTLAAVYLAGFELALLPGPPGDQETCEGGLSCIYFGRDHPAAHDMAATVARRVPLRFIASADMAVGEFVAESMREWAGAVGHSRPPYGAARLVRAAGGRVDALEPVFNLLVGVDDGGAQPASTSVVPRVERLDDPIPRPVPMWSQFGRAALFVLVAIDPGATITGIYDPHEVTDDVAFGVFDRYRAFLRVIAERGGDLALAALWEAAS